MQLGKPTRGKAKTGKAKKPGARKPGWIVVNPPRKRNVQAMCPDLKSLALHPRDLSSFWQ